MDDHSHCEICGRTVEVGSRLCSTPDCIEKKQDLQAEKKRQVYLLLAVLVGAVLLTKFI